MRAALLALCLALLVPVAAIAEDTATPPETKSQEHFIEKSGIRLRLWEKWQDPRDGKPVVILAHGSATAGEESFDLHVPGVPDTSLMDYLASQGFDVFAPDMRGFGRSTRPEGGVSTEDARDDLLDAINHVKTIRAVANVSIVAWSWATQYAGLAVQDHPELVASYVAYAQMHAQSPDIIKRRERLDEFRKATYMSIPEEGWKKRFHSMTPDDANDPRIIDAYAKAASKIETQTPTGPQIDLVTRLPMLDPARIAVPFLMIQGQYDDVATADGLKPFFDAVPAEEKFYLTVPDTGHMAHLQKGRAALFEAIARFLKP